MAGRPDPKPRRETKAKGEGHYAWKGDRASADAMRARGPDLPSSECEDCGRPSRDRHWVDGDLSNSSPENVISLCRRCKMIRDGRLASLAEQSSRASAQRIREGKNRTCPVCGAEFYVKSSHGIRRKYCSVKCKANATRKSPAQKRLRRSERHVPGWSVKNKGETCCRHCGSHRGLHLHHVIPRGKWKAGRADLRNGITLCAECHLGWHDRLVALPISLLLPDELAFVLTADMGQDVRDWIRRNYV